MIDSASQFPTEETANLSPYAIARRLADADGPHLSPVAIAETLLTLGWSMPRVAQVLQASEGLSLSHEATARALCATSSGSIETVLQALLDPEGLLCSLPWALVTLWAAQGDSFLCTEALVRALGPGSLTPLSPEAILRALSVASNGPCLSLPSVAAALHHPLGLGLSAVAVARVLRSPATGLCLDVSTIAHVLSAYDGLDLSPQTTAATLQEAFALSAEAAADLVTSQCTTPNL